MKNIKAYRVTPPDGSSLIVFAKSHKQALGLVAGGLVVVDCGYRELRCRRLAIADPYATNTPSVLWWGYPDSDRIYYDLGWRQHEEPSCDRCGAGEFASIPESIVEGQEDGDEVCRKCLEAEASQRK